MSINGTLVTSYFGTTERRCIAAWDLICKIIRDACIAPQLQGLPLQLAKIVCTLIMTVAASIAATIGMVEVNEKLTVGTRISSQALESTNSVCHYGMFSTGGIL